MRSATSLSLLVRETLFYIPHQALRRQVSYMPLEIVSLNAKNQVSRQPTQMYSSNHNLTSHCHISLI